MKKLIRYRIPVSVVFPKTHKRAGEKTYFPEKITRFCESLEYRKIHTLRLNYNFWEKRFEKILSGQAVLELYYWSGKPYASKTVTICQLSKDDGIGLQKLENTNFINAVIDGKQFDWEDVAKNDGLSFEDFCEWFKKPSVKPLAVIHFTNFRY